MKKHLIITLIIAVMMFTMITSVCAEEVEEEYDQQIIVTEEEQVTDASSQFLEEEELVQQTDTSEEDTQIPEQDVQEDVQIPMPEAPQEDTIIDMNPDEPGEEFESDVPKAEFISQTEKPIKISKIILTKKQYQYAGGNKIHPDFKVMAQGREIKNYTYRLSNARNAGTATLIVEGTYPYTGQLKATFKITKAPLDDVKLCYTSMVYTGKALKQARKSKVTAVLSDYVNKLRYGTDYKASYQNNINVGTAVMTITGIGNYSGSIKKTFTIRPGKPDITKLTVADGVLKANLDISNIPADEYQVQFSRTSEFTIGQTVSVHKKKPSRATKSLTGTYDYPDSGNWYVRARAYKTVEGSIIYSSWSAVKKIKAQHPTDFTSSARLIYRDPVFTNVQGICTDHKKYIYLACRYGGRNALADYKPTMLKKIDQKGNVITANSSTSYCHANSMTYCSKDKNLYIATLGGVVNAQEGVSDAQCRNTIAIVDSKTLDSKGFISLNEQMKVIGPVWNTSGQQVECPNISAINYDEARDVFVCSMRYSKVPNEDTKKCRTIGIAVFSPDWEMIDYGEINSSGQLGNIISDEENYYLILNTATNENRMLVLSKDFQIKESRTVTTVSSGEMEGGDYIGDTLYLNFNNTYRGEKITVEAVPFGTFDM